MKLLEIISLGDSIQNNKKFETEMSNIVNCLILDSVYREVDIDLELMESSDRRFIDFGMQWILCFAESYSEHLFDARNREACMLCNNLRLQLIMSGYIDPKDASYSNQRVVQLKRTMHRTLMQSATKVVLYAMLKQAIVVEDNQLVSVFRDVLPEEVLDSMEVQKAISF